MIELQNVSKLYDSKFAIKEINLLVKKQEAIAIVGPSGSGKTTLLRCLSGLEQPTSGSIMIDDKILGTDKLKHKIGLIFQNFQLFPHIDVLTNLVYAPTKVLKMNQKVAEQKALDLLTQFSLSTKAHAMPSSLSGGQKQRVAILRALMMSPEVLLFDEPTSALDPETIKDVISIINDLKKQMTVIIVTHHINFARATADRIILMEKGSIIADDHTEQFFSNSINARVQTFLNNIALLG